MSAKVSTILKHKGYDIVAVARGQTIAEVVNVLSVNRIGAVPVIDGGQLVGIISERDIIHTMARHTDGAPKLLVEDVMTREVRVCAPEDSIDQIMQIMTSQRIRHVPVIQNGKLRGIISIGDVVKQRLEEAQFEVEALRGYIYTA